MRQIMPHRNNIHLRRINCKIFLNVCRRMRACATFLPQRYSHRFSLASKFVIGNNCLQANSLSLGYSSLIFRHG